MSERYLTEFPTSAELWVERGMALNHLWRYEESLHAFERALEFAPLRLRSRVWSERGEVYQKQGNFGEAIQCYLQAAESESQNGYWWMITAETELLCGDVKQAETTLRYALTLDCKDADYLHNMLGRVLTSLQRYDEATDYYQRALDLYPGYAYAFERLHELKLVQERQSELSTTPGEKLLNEDAEAFPLLFLSRFPETLQSGEEEEVYFADCGRALGKLCRYQEARASFEKAKASNRTIVAGFAWYSQGKMERQRGDYLAARECFIRSLQIYPTGASQLQLGGTLAWSGQTHEAEQRLRGSLEEGEDGATLVYLGRVLSTQKRYAEAADCFRGAIEANPNDVSAKVRLLDVDHTLRWQRKHGN